MGEYTATVSWDRSGAYFTDNGYSRSHSWTFDGGMGLIRFGGQVSHSGDIDTEQTGALSRGRSVVKKFHPEFTLTPNQTIFEPCSARCSVRIDGPREA
jgi:hypothetical protein